MFKRLMISLAFVLAPGVIWAQIIVIGGGGLPPVSPGPVKPVVQAIVVDVIGRQLGSTSAFFGGPAIVLIEVEGRVVSLNVMKSGITSTGANLYFSTPDCSGAAYTSPDFPDALIQPAVIGPPGKTLYAPKAGAAPQLVTIVAQVFVPPVGAPTCLLIPPPPAGVPAPGPALLVPADKLVDLNQFFLPPFSIRTQ